MPRWSVVRFTDETRIELVSQEIVRPLSDRFRYRGCGGERPAGIFVVCAFGRTVASTDPDVARRGSELVDEVRIRQIVQIRGASVAGGSR